MLSTPIVPRTGFEPVAHSLEGCCSIQLSYRGISKNFSDSEAASPDIKSGSYRGIELYFDTIAEIISRKISTLRG